MKKSEQKPAKTAVKKRTMASEVWHRLLKNKLAMIGLVILVVMILLAVFADVIADYDTMVVENHMSERLQGPSLQHIFGTDEFGRDIFARMIHGSRISLTVGFISVWVAIVIGSVIGAISGYYGGTLDNIIMRIMDVFLAIPSILLSITIVAAFGSSMLNLCIAISISSIPSYARFVRASVMSVKDQEFVESSRAIGARVPTLIFREIIPNCLSPIIVQATLSIAGAILSIAGLSFMGLGIQAPTPEWGSMLSSGREFMRDALHLTLFPGLAIVITVLALNMLGDGLRDALDPRLKQ